MLQENPTLLISSVFLLSLLVGSFLNVVIHRLPIMLDRQWKLQADEVLGKESAPPSEPYNLVVPRSACPHCGAPIKSHQNIPVVSYLLLGGKCASCKAKIAPRYPIVELGTAILSAAVALRFGWHWQTVAACLHLGARGTHGHRPRPPDPPGSSRCRCSGSACC
jgi:leader peptidase (prepilin peptidase)/N-methyltransferase